MLIHRLALAAILELRADLPPIPDEEFPPVILTGFNEQNTDQRDELPEGVGPVNVTIFGDWGKYTSEQRREGLVGFLQVGAYERVLFYTTVTFSFMSKKHIVEKMQQGQAEKINEIASEGQAGHIAILGSKSGGTRVWLCTEDLTVRENWQEVESVWHEVAVAFSAVYGPPRVVS